MIRLIWTAAVLVATAALMAISVAPWDADVEASGHSATRAFAAPWVAPGGTMEVAITARGYGALGRVIETLPEGFGYAGSTLPDSAVNVEGDTLKFTLLGEERFSYTVTAPAVEGQYSFSGALLDANVVREEVGGDTLLRVGSEPTATPTPGAAATATAVPEPTATHTPVPTVTPVPEPTVTPVPEPTATHTPEPTATHTPEPTATQTPEPTATQTPEPTATHTPVPTATHTPEPTATHTPTPQPTATHTPEPTATPTPKPEPSATPLSLPIPTPVTTGGGSGGGSAAPLGIVVGLLILGALLLVGRAYMRFRASR